MNFYTIKEEKQDFIYFEKILKYAFLKSCSSFPWLRMFSLNKERVYRLFSLVVRLEDIYFMILSFYLICTYFYSFILFIIDNKYDKWNKKPRLKHKCFCFYLWFILFYFSICHIHTELEHRIINKLSNFNFWKYLTSSNKI